MTNKPLSLIFSSLLAMSCISSFAAGDKTLVVYYSHSGITKAVAQKAAALAGADLFEIEPEIAYSDKDVDYRDPNSRASKEHADASSRPAIKKMPDNLAQYGTVLIGYPIWWGEAPRIIYTFSESVNLDGIAAAPFCTSGSSGIGNSAELLAEHASKNALWMSGKCFDGSSTQKDVQSWLDSIGIATKE